MQPLLALRWQDDPVLTWIYLGAQLIAMVGFIFFFWLVWSCERDLRKIREENRKRREK